MLFSLASRDLAPWASPVPDPSPAPVPVDATVSRALVVTSLRRRGMTGVQTHLAEAEHLLSERFDGVDVVSLDTLRPVRAGLVVGLVHLLGRVPLNAARFAQWGLVSKALTLATAHQVRRDRPDVVYAQDTRSAAAALDARGDAGYAVVMVVHFNESEASELVGLGTIRPDSRAYRRLWAFERDVLRRLDGIVFVSDFMRRHVLEEVPEARGVPHRTLPNCLEAPSPALAPPPVTGDLVSVGMLVDRKNHEYLLDVLAAARASGRDRTLTVVGDGPNRRALHRRAEELGVADLVTFAGRRDDVDAVLPGHRVYVHSAHMENAPYALIEAMRAGLPVVTAAVGGIPEVVGTAGAGHFWPLDDPAAGATVLDGLLDDDAAHEHASAAATHRFATVFDEAVSGNWLGDFLEQVTAGRA